jgi:hypothetical protein
VPSTEVVNDPRVVASYLGSSEEVINRSGVGRTEPRRRPRATAAGSRAGSKSRSKP